ncbi:MAG: phytoene/squalene synthase family protein [Planctomycetota bacterium]
MNTITARRGRAISQGETTAISKHSRSFSFAARFLPASIRGDVEDLYAWCRACDDAVDHATSREDAKKHLSQLREDLWRIERGQPTLHPASRYVQPLIEGGVVRTSLALDLIEGMRMDLEWRPIESDSQLMRYAYHAAGVVGLMMCDVMRVKNPAARRHAKSLGMAMQLTNITRDVREDADRGRVYLPRIRDVDDARPARVQAEVERVLALADVHYRIAGAGMHYLPGRCQIAIGVAAAVYREIGQEIRRKDCRVLAGRTIVPKSRFLSVAMSAAASAATRLLCQKFTSWFHSLFPQSRPMNASSAHAAYLVYLGLSLTAFMASALFVMVYFNPKYDEYAGSPLIYSAASVLAGLVTMRLAMAAERRGDAAENQGKG